MKAILTNQTRRRNRSASRRGSVLVVVLALLSALMLLGFLFYTSASQERANARYFAQSEKNYATSLEAEELFDFALEQVIVGPRDDYVNSALWGGRYSLLPNLVGTNMVPYNGPGVNVVDMGEFTGSPANGIPGVNQDYNTTADTLNRDSDALGALGVDDRLTLNMAGWAVGAALPVTVLPEYNPQRYSPPYSGPIGTFPEPDANYTYPDINSVFLALVTTEPLTGRKVIIPSFHRPQYLRGYSRLVNGADPASVFPTWYTDAQFMPYMLRPHTERKIQYFNYNTGQIVTSDLDRFLPAFWDTAAPTSADPDPNPNTISTLVAEGDWNQQWVPHPDTGVDIPQYDIDANNDGVKEAIILDLDHPVEETADGTQQFIPMYGITIFDLDALFNLNAHGNLYGAPRLLSTNPFLSPDVASPFLSQSNEGRHRHEVNLEFGLTAPPSAAGAAHTNFFGHGPASRAELANMEFWFLLAGRVEKDVKGNVTQIYKGRWGEADILKAASLAGTSNIFAYPGPGVTHMDDARTSDGRRGLIYRDPQGRVFPRQLPSNPAQRFWLSPGGHPEDHQGQGSYVANVTGGGNIAGVTPLVTALGLPSPGRVSVLRYIDYWFPTATPNGPGPDWVDAQLLEMFAPSIAPNVNYGLRTVSAVYGTFAGYHIDNPGETILDAFQARSQITDSIYGAEETAALHLTKTDYDQSGIVSRLLKLVPANFAELDIRKKYTTVSSDLKAYGNAVGKRWVGATQALSDNRAWENGLYKSAASEGFEKNVFPPFVSGLNDEEAEKQNRNIYGFRLEARGILQQQGVMPTRRKGYALDREIVKGLIHKLSVNHVAAQHVNTSDGRPQFFLRPLTPHPTQDLPREEIPAPDIFDADGVLRPPATSDAELGDGLHRAHFGMPDSWVIQEDMPTNGFPTWRMSATRAAAVGFATGSAGAAQLQEWHARRDRQNMARDIYTLLYVFGHVNPNFNPMTDDPRKNVGGYYDNNAMREMAQFAVNVVDAMDPDDTITLFVYDKNLSDGYTLLDSGYGTLPDGVTPAAPDYNSTITSLPKSGNAPIGTYEEDGRGMVFGVEAQQLAFNEVLAVLAKEYDDDDNDTSPAQDHEATLWKDTAHRDFIYAELQNMLPTQVTLNRGWSIVCQPESTVSGGPTFQARSLTITPPSGGLTGSDPNGNAYTNVVEPGETFTIGAAGDDHLNDNPPGYSPPSGNKYGSAMRVDKDGDATTPPADFASFEKIAPAATGAALQFDAIDAPNNELNVNDYLPTRPWDDGILVNQTNITVETGMTVPPYAVGSAWLDLGAQKINDTDTRDDIQAGEVTVTFSLRRRANLYREFPLQDNSAPDEDQQMDNPWIVVDVCKKVPLRVFDPAASTPASLPDKLHELVSSKRREPLDREDILGITERNVSTFQMNNLGGYHTTSPPRATIWQRHYDRSFASLAGVLQVPLYGPKDLTGPVNNHPLILGEVAAVDDLTSVAMARFLFPEGEPRKIDEPAPDSQVRPNGNLWYRALAFLEVPEKYGNPDGWPWFVDFAGPVPWGGPDEEETLQTRRYGKINLNTLRHPHVHAGLLDDQRVMIPNFAPGLITQLPSKRTTVTMDFPPPFGTVRRDWWTSMLASRDGGVDEFSSNYFGRNVILPGVPAADPFKGFSVAPVGTGSGDIHKAFSQTFLRPMFGDDQTPTTFNPPDKLRRSLFALGNKGTTELGSTADLATRYRLLGKVLKHGTTRSNSYVIFMTCDFYEAEQAVDAAGHNVYQIGQKMPADPDNEEEPRYRGVFVVDRTLALEMLQKRDLPPTSPRLVFPTGSRYRTFSFAREPGGNGQAQPTFDWRKLLLYRNAVKDE